MSILRFSHRGLWARGLLLLLTVGSTGCMRTRSFWRSRADREVAYLVAEKSNNPRWALPPGFNLNLDPRSRYYDATNPDRPPLPPDDPYAHTLMHDVSGHRGSPFWHLNGELPQLPNPGWRQRLAEYCKMNPQGAIVMDLPAALELSYIHSPAYRSVLETIYLSALDVSTQRFQFKTQIYPGFGTNWARSGSASPGATRVPPGPPIANSVLTQSAGAASGHPAILERQFVTGGTLLANFANSFVWQFAGPKTNTVHSLVNFNFIQPLLQSGGRIFNLERLTLVERTLLYNLRGFELFRQGWFSYIAIGTQNNYTANALLARQGGAFGGTGITGTFGQGANGLGGVAAASNFTGGGGGGGGALQAGQTAAVAGAAGGGVGLTQGFIGLLQQKQQIINAQTTLNLQFRTLRLLEANLAAGLIGIAQVDIFRQSIQTAQANLLQAKIGLANSRDQFLMTFLGLPPDLPIELDVEMLRPMRLVEPALNSQQDRFREYIERVGNLPEQPSLEQIQQALADLQTLRTESQGHFAPAREDLAYLEGRAPARLQQMTADERRAFLDDKQRLHERLDDLVSRFGETEATLQQYRAQATEQNAGETADQLVALATTLSNMVQELMLIKALARVDAVAIEPISLSTVDALQIARAHRLDWMNARANLVDKWRLVWFNANQLRSNVTITTSGNAGTVGSNPLDFRADTGQYFAGLQFDPPITRLLERNNYRQQLIFYQQTRRALIQFEDAANLKLRVDMRVLKQLQLNLEIQRQAVKIAVRRVDEQTESLNQPPPVAAPGTIQQSLGPTAANNLIIALQSLSDSQNAFMSVWLAYYSNRLQLYQDLGVFRLDERGMWIDEPLDRSLASLEQMYPLPPEIPVDWWRLAGGVDPSQEPAVPYTEGVPSLEYGSEGLEFPRYRPGAFGPNMSGGTGGGYGAPANPPGGRAAGAGAAKSQKKTWRERLFGKPAEPAKSPPAPADNQPQGQIRQVSTK